MCEDGGGRGSDAGAALSGYADSNEEDGIVGNGLSSDTEWTEASDVILLRGVGVCVCVGR
jgi:hypothetical protein